MAGTDRCTQRNQMVNLRTATILTVKHTVPHGAAKGDGKAARN